MTRKGEQTRARILDEAASLFNRKGFGATTINEILTASGTTKGNLYFHFSGKEAIALEVLAREKAAFMEFLEEVLNEGPPTEGLGHFFEAALMKHHQRDFIGGCIFGNLALEASDTSPVFAAFVAEVFTDWTLRITQSIERAQQAGRIRRDLTAAALAEMVVAAVEGGIMQARLVKSDVPLRTTLDTLQKIILS